MNFLNRDKFENWKERLKDKIEIWRLRIATHPKTIIWRLRIFGFHPFLGQHLLKIIGGILAVLLVYGVFYGAFWRAPRPFPDDALITVERGSSLSQIVNNFEENSVVRSSLWLRAFIMVLGGENKVVAGDYYFPEAVSVFKVAWMLHRGEFGLIAIRVTIPEGSSSFEIGDIIKKEIPSFDAKGFVNEVADNDYEGYLFPDTYFFMPNTKPGDAILMMRENFARAVKDYEQDILKSGHSLRDLIIMASIVEGEAGKSLDSKRMVAGILWKRISKKMLLQVDAPFRYYNGKHSYTLTKDDLKEDHPYNTYVNKGLPPTAIGNPGIDSIRAAIAPTNSQYLFFMSDRSGNMYYAKDFEGHKLNRELHL